MNRKLFSTVMFGAFLLGIGYLGYANAILKSQIAPIDRFVILTLSVFGVYFLFSKLVLGVVVIVKKVRSRKRGH